MDGAVSANSLSRPIPSARAATMPRRSLGGFLVAALAVLAVPAIATAIPDLPAAIGSWDPRLFDQGIAPQAVAIAASGDDVYIAGGPGGGYKIVAGDVLVNGIAVWNAPSGLWAKLPGEFGGPAGWTVIDQLAVFGGSLYVSGIFQTIDGQPYPGLARWDGSTWSTLGSGVEGSNFRLRVIHGGLFVFGVKKADGLTFTSVGLWDGSAWFTLPYDDYDIAAIAARDDEAFSSSITGSFSLHRYNGDTTGNATWGQTIGADLLTFFQDHLFAAGRFTMLGPDSASYIAHWNGTAWKPVGSGVPGGVTQLIATDDALYVAVRIEHHDPSVVMRWNGTQWTTLGEIADEKSTFANIASMTYEDGKLYVAGHFDSIAGVYAPNSAYWDVDGQAWHGIRDSRGNGLNNNVHSLAANQSGVYVGGLFNRAGEQEVAGLLRWNNGGWSPLGESGAVGIEHLAASGKKLYAVGDWKRGDEESYGVSRWNGTAWGPVRWPKSSSTMEAVTAYKGRLYAAGEFEVPEADPNPGFYTNGLAIWDGARWTYPPARVSGNVHAIAVTSNGSVFLGGDLDKVENVPVSRIARWDGQKWSALGVVYGGSVNHLVAVGNAVYVGGDFEAIDGLPYVGLAKWEDGLWSPVGGLDGETRALAVDGIALYAERVLDNYPSQDVRMMLRWDGITWEAVSEAQFHNAIAARGGQLFTGGFSLTADGGIPSSNVARWTFCELDLDTCSAIASTTTTTLDTTTTTSTSTTSSSTTITSSTTTTTTLFDSCGDADEDGDLDPTDALLALRAAVGLGQCPATSCDVNANGQLTAIDALIILKSSVGLPVILDCPVTQ